MKKYFMIGLIAALSPSVSFGYSARINELIAQKQAKMKELEKCQGTTKNLKIAGLSTLGITAVGVGANIAEAVLLNEYEGKVSKARKDKEDAQAAYDKAFKSNLEKRGDAAAKREREQAKYQHSCSHSESFDNLDGVIAAANAKTGVECKPANQEFNNTNCEITDFGVMTCSIDLKEGEETRTHTYKHTFNTKNGDCSGIYTNEMASSQEDAQQKIAKAINKSNIKCDFDGNTATCYEVGNMFVKYTCKFGEIASSQPKNNILTFRDEKEFAKVHLSNNNTLVQLKRIVGVWSNKNDKKIDVDTCGDIEKHDTGQDFAKCSSPSDNIRYIFEFNALDSSTSVEPSLVEYVCEKWFNGEYKYNAAAVRKKCTVAHESVQACVEYIMDNKGTADKCNPTAEEKQEANISEIPVFKDSISLFEDKNLDQAMRLIKWYDPDVDASNCKVKTKSGIFKQDHVTCGEKRFMFYDLTASKSTAKDSLTKYFCTEFSGGSVNDGKCSGNDDFVQKCVEHVMNGDGECLTPQGVAKRLENEKKEKERIEAEVEAKIKERKQKYCGIMECEVDKCYVTGKDNFWKVKCSDKKDTTPVCFKKDDNDNKKYDCDEGITLEEKASREQEKKDKEQSRKDTFCPIVGCPVASCQIRDMYDVNRSGFIKLTCSGNSDKNGCFKEGSKDEFYDCDTLQLHKKVTQIKGKWFVNHAEEYLEKQGLLKENCVSEADNKIVCGKNEYQFGELIDVELDNDKFSLISASNKEDAKQKVMEYTKNACTSVRVEKNVATCYISTNDSPAKVSHKFKFLNIEKSK